MNVSLGSIVPPIVLCIRCEICGNDDWADIEFMVPRHTCVEDVKSEDFEGC